MIKKIDKLVLLAKEASKWILATHEPVRIFSHYDADGITAATILIKSLLRIEKPFHLTLLKQLRESIIKEIATERYNLIVFLDLGSSYLEQISKFLSDRKIIIADHHQIEGSASKNILHINPLLVGIDENISGAGVAYLLARALGEENKELASLAIIGAIGDSQIGSLGQDWGLLGLNREIMLDAVNAGKLKMSKGLRLWGRYTRPLHKALEYSFDPFIPGITGSESACIQFLNELGIPPKDENGNWRTLASLSEEEQKKLADGIIAERIKNSSENPDWIFGDVYELIGYCFKDANEFATILNAAAKMGKPELGIMFCLGMKSEDDAKKILEIYRKEIGKAISWVEKNKDMIKRTENAYYLIAGSNISEYIISNVISTIYSSGMFEIDESKPIFAFADTEEGEVKVSARISKDLVDINLKEIVKKAAEKVGGEGGGHAAAAGAVIPKGSVDAFIKITESILNSLNSKTNINNHTNDKKPKEVENVEKRSSKKMEGQGLVRYLSS